jgi:glycosyltransferase involved in cell wall biosynthesis
MQIGALIMVKNEEKSIKTTIDSLKGHINTIIVYDTGSTDNTLSIIVKSCQANNQTLHIKTTNTFNNFAESRNESIKFAESIDVDYLLLMDAGDELKTDLSTNEFSNMISNKTFYGILKLKWLENGIITEHDGLRIIKNKSQIRYDPRYPVHEQIVIKNNSTLSIDNFYLYQNRDKYGENTMKRINRDIEQLSSAIKCRHNYYYLAQSYSAIGDIENSYKYNVLALENQDGSVDDILIISRLIYCSLIKNMDKTTIIKYFNLALDKNCQLLEPFLNILRYCINNKIYDIIDPHLTQITEFDKAKSNHFNHEDYDYNRWDLIARYCILTKRNLELARETCKKAIAAKHKQDDITNLTIIENMISYIDPSTDRPSPNSNQYDTSASNSKPEPTTKYIETKNETENQTEYIIPNQKSIDFQTDIGVLIMVKNESESIHCTIESTKTHFDHIIVYDTGSTDDTISIIKNTCNKNNQYLHINKADTFKGFPQSRNEAIEFAETINVDYLLMMDAGDEFKCELSKKDFIKNIKTIFSKNSFGVVKQIWAANNINASHCDIRFIKNKANCRYNLDYPIHEKFIIDERIETPPYLGNIFSLYQNRELYGRNRNERYSYDIEMLSKAKVSTRNYFFLAQTYMDIQDFKNGYIYNKKAYVMSKITNNDNVDIETVLVRLLYCAISCKMDDAIIFKHFNESIEFSKKSNTIIDSYIYFLHYCIEKKRFDLALPLLEPLSKLEINTGSPEITRYEYFTYERWHLISVISLMSKQKLELGKIACQKAIDYAHKQDDINNLSFFTASYFRDPPSEYNDNINIQITEDYIPNQTQNKNTKNHKGRIICVDNSGGFKNVLTHKDSEKIALGASEHQLFYLLKNIAQYKEVHVFKATVKKTIKIDNIYYKNFDEFNNYELYENDIIIIQRFICENPNFLNKLKNNKTFMWVHDMTDFNVFISDGSCLQYYNANPQVFKGYLTEAIIKNDNINFVFPSNFAKDRFTEFLNRYQLSIISRRLQVIHNILYEEDFTTSTNSNTNTNKSVDTNKIVFASSWFKNIACIIKLFEHIHMRNKDYILVFMEHGFDTNKKYENIMREKFGKNVEILGPQNKEKYAEIIKSSLCLLVSTYPETFGCVFTESQYLGTPVIADYRSGAVADHLDKDFVMNYDDPESVYLKLEWLRKERMTLNTQLDEKFTFKPNFEKWKTLLNL